MFVRLYVTGKGRYFGPCIHMYHHQQASRLSNFCLRLCLWDLNSQSHQILKQYLYKLQAVKFVFQHYFFLRLWISKIYFKAALQLLYKLNYLNCEILFNICEMIWSTQTGTWQLICCTGSARWTTKPQFHRTTESKIDILLVFFFIPSHALLDYVFFLYSK